MLAVPTQNPAKYPPIPPRNCVFYMDLLDNGEKVIEHVDGNNGACNGQTTTPLGKLFNGTSHYINLDATKSKTNIINAPLSIFMWAKPITGIGTNSWWICKSSTATNQVQYDIHYDNSNKKIAFRLEGVDAAHSANNSINLDVFNFVGAVWKGPGIQCYVNGLANGSPTSRAEPLTSRELFNVGRFVAGSAYFKGVLGEIWIMRDAPSAMEIKALFEETAWKYGVKI